MASVSISWVKTLRLLGYETELRIIYAMILFGFSVSTILKAICLYCVSEMTRDMKNGFNLYPRCKILSCYSSQSRISLHFMRELSFQQPHKDSCRLQLEVKSSVGCLQCLLALEAGQPAAVTYGKDLRCRSGLQFDVV